MRCAFGLISAALVLGCLEPTLLSQPAFEVASVKQNRTGERMNFGFPIGSDRLTGRNMPLKGWIQIAYQLKDFQVAGGPGWVVSEGFDIEAKAPRPVSSTNEMFALLQALLVERFGLAFHRETRESPVYALVIAKSGVKMKASKDQTAWVGDYRNGAPDGRTLTGASPTELAPGRIAGAGIPITLLSSLLSTSLDRTVINKTGLSGRYDVDLRYTPGTDLRSGDGAESVFTAVQDQLGLKLESAKAPVEVLVIDRAQQPSVD